MRAHICHTYMNLHELTHTSPYMYLHTYMYLRARTGAAQGYECFPSEGGHAEFAPHNEIEAELLDFLTIKFGGRVSVERVVSGSGIPNVS